MYSWCNDIDMKMTIFDLNDECCMFETFPY